MAEGQARRKRSSWAWRLLIWAGGLVLLVVVLAIAAKYWVIPSVVRARARSVLAGVWNGRAELRALQFNYLSPPRVGGLELYGPDGRQWVHVRDIRLQMRGWPGTHPYLTGVEIDGVRLAAHVSGGGLRLPIRRPRPSPKPSGTGGRYLDLRSLRVKNVSVAVVDDDIGRRSQWLGIEVSVVRRVEGELYDVAVEQTAGGGKVTKVLAGTVRADDLQADLRLLLNGQITETEAGMLLALLKVAGVRELSGRVRADLTVTGRLDRPASLLAKGTLGLEKWRASAKEGPVVDELDLAASLDGRSGSVVARVQTPAWSADVAEANVAYGLEPLKLTAELRKGTVEIGLAGDYGPFWGKLLKDNVIRGRSDITGDGSYDPSRAQPVDYQVILKPEMKEVTFAGLKDHSLRDLTARQVRFGPTRASVTGLRATYAKGRLDVDADAWLAGDSQRPHPALADWADLNRIEAAAKVSLDNIDTMAIPILPALIGLMGPAEAKFGLSDAAAVVTLDKSIITFQSGRLANPISAMEVEKGGTINLATKQLDLQVVGVPLRLLRSILTRIPLLNLAVDFKDKLVRFSIRGPWTDSPAKLIKKEPVKDIAQGTADFFKGVVKTGGELGPALLKGVTDILTLPQTLREMDEKNK